ncbi:hypothetical protein [Desertivirga arenae]|uniref:hypothetical protein n=1 Tax=Desertivirga arenae TaxID=2810309 RepID=UPI001A95BC4D|nr:hypothetical protein [Pedobacter sp. SYSU D00823]
MEKVRFPPLIEYLKESSDEYNKMYYQQELKSGAINSMMLSKWIVQNVEPLIIAVHKVAPESLPKVFKALYASSLSLLGNNLAITHEEEYKHGWNLCLHIPQLLVLQPQRILNAINTALESLRQHQPEKVLNWLNLMRNLATKCKSVELFLDYGRFAAWTCGMAHLREKAAKIYLDLPGEVLELIQGEVKNVRIADLIELGWRKEKYGSFEGVAGGFYGYGKAFIQPPLVALVENIIVASDGVSSSALFADALGTVLISDIPVSADYIKEQALQSRENQLRKIQKHFPIPFDDVTSVAANKSTLVVSRSSSHYLFLYSIPHE